MSKKKRTRRMVLVCVMAILLLFALFPIYWMFVSSFKPFGEVYLLTPKLWPGRFEWKKYIDIFTRYNYGVALENSIKVSLAVSVISILVAIFSAYCVIRLRFRGRRIVPHLICFLI